MHGLSRGGETVFRGRVGCGPMKNPKRQECEPMQSHSVESLLVAITDVAGVLLVMAGEDNG